MKERKLEIYLFFILLAITAYLSIQIFSPYLYSLIIAAIFAVVFKPLHEKISKSIPKHRGLSALLAVIVVSVLVLLPLTFYGMELSDEVKNFYDFAFSKMQGGGIMVGLTEGINNLIQSTSPFGIKWPVFDTGETETYVFTFLSWLRGHFGDIFSGLAKFFVSLFIFLIAFYYFLKDGEGLRKAVIKISPFKDERDEAILNRLQVAIISIIKGQILVAIIQGFVTGLGLFIFGVPSPVLWAGIAAIAALIPGIGTGLVNLPAVLFLVFSGQIPHAIGMLLWAMLAVGFIDNFLGPKLMQKGIRIHPFVILLSVLGGIGYFGVIGFILGPITLSFLVALIDIYKTIIVKETNEHSI